ncbi:MAG: DUF2975 domain-containing protein [bacterium]|nr:DUF2975 domain-containing protein [bacterium]
MKNINKATKYIIDVMFYIGILCVVSVPFSSKYIGHYYGYNSFRTILFSAMLIVTGLAAVYILFNLKKMFKTLINGNPFVSENTNCLRKMSVTCMIIAVVYVLKCFLLFSFATVIIVIVFGIGCMFCLVLKDIFSQSISYKEEHDWTV